MPRGRHRQAPPLHRLLVPSAVAAFASLCAAGSLFVSGTTALRVLTLVAASCAMTGAVLLRVWDRGAGLRVGEVKAARANAELLADERAAEIEADLREAREIRGKLERRLRSRRAELAKLRTEHAGLLRRYANAETERANALEGRRKLAIAAAEPVKELTTGAADHRSASGAPTALTYLQADRALSHLGRAASRQRAQRAESEAADGRPADAGAGAAAQPGVNPGQAGGSAQTDGGAATRGFDFFGGSTQPARSPETEPRAEPSTTHPDSEAEASAARPSDHDAGPQWPQQDAVRPRQVASKVIDVSE